MITIPRTCRLFINFANSQKTYYASMCNGIVRGLRRKMAAIYELEEDST